MKRHETNRNSRINLPHLIFLSIAGLFISLLVRAQSVDVKPTITEDEIRWGSRPYLPRPVNAIQVRTDMVEVPVVVRDSTGAVVKGLTKDDFEVYDENRKRDVSFFSVETAPINAPQKASASSVFDDTPAPQETRKPRYVAFFFDDSNMSPGDTNASRNAAAKFVRDNLEPGEKVGIFTSSTTVSLNFTDDKSKLLETLAQIRARQRSVSGAENCPHLSPYEAFLITQSPDTPTDALSLGIAQASVCGACPVSGGAQSPCGPIVLGVARETLVTSEIFSEDTLGILSDVITHLGRMPGRRMLVMTSSGFMVQTNGPRATQDKVIDSALKAGVVINSLDAKGLWAAPPGGDPADWMNRVAGGILDGNQSTNQALADYQDRLDDMQRSMNDDPLSAVAEGTGGRFFRNSNDMAGGFLELATEPEVSYVLGFSPDNINPNGNLHALKVKLTNPSGHTVAARHGYFAPTKKDVEELAAEYARRDKLDRAVQANDLVTDISATVNAQPAQLSDGLPGLKVVVHVDTKNLPFVARNGRNLETLIIVAALFDDQDHFLTGAQGVMDLTLKDATLTQLGIKGLDADLSLQAPPGHYRLRQVVQEEATGRLAALNTAVEIK
jgi:VWFA-related protein